MDTDRESMLALLQDGSFSCPSEWIDYGLSHNFFRVAAERLEACPDCGGRTAAVMGQFVYYSNLVRLKACKECWLIYSDTRIDPHVIQEHFEQAYKDESYFQLQRRQVFRQLALEVDAAAPRGGRVLDIGGAKGHLMAQVRALRPDLSLVVNDLSAAACAAAAENFGLVTVTGGVQALEQLEGRFDVLVMSDVAYYEPELGRLWALVRQLLNPEGTVIIRVPNKLHLIRTWQALVRLRCRSRLQTRLRFFNPEHLYLFSRRYLALRLRKIGFSEVKMVPSALLARNQNGQFSSILYYLSQQVYKFSAGTWIITPSMLIIAGKLKK